MANYTAVFQQNPLLNNTNSSLVSATDFASSYIGSMPSLIQQGDLVAIILGLILFFIALVVINKLSSILLAVIRRSIVFIITFIVLYTYIPVFIDKIMIEGFTIQNILIGVAGSIVCLFAFTIASIALFKDAKQVVKEKRQAQSIQPIQSESEELIIEQREDGSFSLLSFAHDKSLLNLLTYLTVAQFGVFSSVTLAAPNVKVGLSLLVLFVIASLIFIKQSYKDYKKGLSHLAIAFIVGFILSLLLGTMWGNQTISQLLSMQYFSSDSLVALITGMAVSLFAGSKKG